MITIDRQGFFALYRAADAALVATKRVSTNPLVGLQQCGPDVYAIATDHAVSIWRIRRELPYNVFRGGHTAAVISLYACSGGLVCFLCTHWSPVYLKHAVALNTVAVSKGVRASSAWHKMLL